MFATIAAVLSAAAAAQAAPVTIYSSLPLLRCMSNILRAIASAIWVTEQARMSLQPVGYRGASSPRKAWGPIWGEVSHVFVNGRLLTAMRDREIFPAPSRQ